MKVDLLKYQLTLEVSDMERILEPLQNHFDELHWYYVNISDTI